MFCMTKILVRFLHCVGIIILGTGCTTTHEYVLLGFEEARIILADGEELNRNNRRFSSGRKHRFV